MERIECIEQFRKKMLDCYRYFSAFIVNKNNLFKKYFNEHQKKIFIYMIVGIVSLTIHMGIGTSLLQNLQTEASQQGVAIFLRVLKVNPAKRLYERLGFEAVQEKEKSYKMRSSP